MSPFLVAFTIVIASSISLVTSLRPFIERSGATKVVVLFDMHDSVDTNGQCSGLRLETVEMVQAVVWAFDRLSESGRLSRDVGLSVYDTCSSDVRAREMMYDVIQVCAATPRTKLGAVISHVSGEVAAIVDEIADVTGHVHVRMNSFPCMKERKHRAEISVHLTSLNAMRSLMAAIEPLNWRYITTVSLGHSIGSVEQDHFQTLARKNDVCIRESIKLNSEKPLTLPTVESTGVIVFTTGMTETQLNQVLSSMNQTRNSVIIWNRSNLTLPSTPTPTNNATEQYSVLSIADTLPTIDEFIEYFQILQTLNDIDPNTVQYLTTKQYCAKHPTRNVVSQCVPDLAKQLRTTLSGYHVHASISGMLLVQQSFQWYKNMPCNLEYTFVDCMKTIDLSMDHIQTSFTKLDLRTRYAANVSVTLGDLVEIQRPFEVTAPLTAQTELPIGMIENETFYLVNETSWTKVGRHVPLSHCTGYCPECMRIDCPKIPKRSEPAIVIPGEIVIAGTFPIHSPSASGVTCGDVSVQGVMAAETFVWAVETFKDRYVDSFVFSNTSLGAVVFDTCSITERNAQLVDDYTGCVIKPKRNSSLIKPSDVLAHFSYIEGGIHRRNIAESMPTVSVSSVGSGIGEMRGNYIITAIKNVLLELEQQRVTIVYSDINKPFCERLESAMRDSKIHIIYKMEYSSNVAEAERRQKRKFLSQISNESRSILVLTNPEDTLLLLTELSISDIKGNMDFIFMPWQTEVISSLSQNVTAGSLMLQVETLDNDICNAHWKALASGVNPRNPWWNQYQDSKRKCKFSDYKTENPLLCNDDYQLQQSLYGYIVQFTDLMLLSLNKVYTKLCGESGSPCSELYDKANVTRIFDDVVTKFSALLSTGKSLQFSNSKEVLLPMNIVNIRIKDPPVVIGSIGTDAKLTLFHRDLLEKYDADGHVRPTIDPTQHKWCPRCYQCENATEVTDNYFYLPGDVIVVGVFPLHKRGKGSFDCGRISPNGYVEAEAFKYAVRTVKHRHGDVMLPGVNVGALILDSCSTVESMLSKVLNFESCKESYHIPYDPYTWPASPKMVIGYVAEESAEVLEPLYNVINKLGKTLVSPVNSVKFQAIKHPNMLTTASTNERQAEAVISFLRYHNWTKVAVVCSKEYQEETNEFSKSAGMRNVCLSDIYYLETLSYATVESVISRIEANDRTRVILTLLNPTDSVEFFDIVEKRMMNRIWINIGSHNWITIARRVAKGTIFVDKIEGYHHGFYDAYFSNRIKEETSPLPWKSEVLEFRKWCNNLVSGKLYEKNCLDIESDYLRLRAKSIDMHRLIEAVDSLLHGFNKVYADLCPDREHLCARFANTSQDYVSKKVYHNAKSTTFTSESQVVRFRADGRAEDMGMYIFQTYEPKQEYRIGTPKLILISEWYDGKLNMKSMSEMVIYDLNGYPYKTVRSSQYTKGSHCINFEPTKVDYEYPHDDFTRVKILESVSPAKFVPEIWVLVLVGTVGIGCFASLFMLLYVLAKLFVGSLRGANVWFGFLLIVGIIILYCSSIPYFFTPSRLVCGMRHLAPSVAYAFCFAIMLVKLTNLRELSSKSNVTTRASRLNNCIFTLLITGVQIAVCVQWWVLRSPVVIINPTGTCSCKFDVTEFVTSQVYNMFLLFLCAIYSPTVCRSRANLREGQLICAYSWLAGAVWLGWVLACFIAPREFVEPAISIGIILCASLMILVIFLPKLARISNIQYDLRHLSARSSYSGYTDTQLNTVLDKSIQPNGISYIDKDMVITEENTNTAAERRNQPISHRPLQRNNRDSLDCYY